MPFLQEQKTVRIFTKARHSRVPLVGIQQFKVFLNKGTANPRITRMLDEIECPKLT